MSLKCHVCNEDMTPYPFWILEYNIDSECMEKTHWEICSSICLLELSKNIRMGNF